MGTSWEHIENNKIQKKSNSPHPPQKDKKLSVMLEFGNPSLAN
jgi:hypothetical protein